MEEIVMLYVKHFSILFSQLIQYHFVSGVVGYLGILSNAHWL
jgi:hypothetical protein